MRSRRQPVPRERADDHPEQDEVDERVGEVDRDLEPLARGGRAHALEDERGADRGDGERGDEPVHPQRARDVAGAGAQQREHADQHQRREEQVAGVGRRRDRDLLRRPQDRRVVDLPQGPGGDAGADPAPGPALAASVAAKPTHTHSPAPASEDDVVAEAREERAGVGSRARTTCASQSTSQAATSTQRARRTAVNGRGCHTGKIGACTPAL